MQIITCGFVSEERLYLNFSRIMGVKRIFFDFLLTGSGEQEGIYWENDSNYSKESMLFF